MSTQFDFDRRTRLAGFNQVVILAAILLPAFGALFASTLTAASVMVLIALLGLPLTHVGARSTIARLGGGVFLFATTAWGNWLIGSHTVEPALFAGMRVLAVALPGLLYSTQIRPFPLGDALVQVLRLPARPVLVIVMALQRALLLAEQWEEIGHIRRSRGLAGRTAVGSVRELSGRTVVFLVAAIRSASQLSAAMETRGMLAWDQLDVPRGRWEEAPWRRRDTAALGVIVAIAVLPILLRVLLPA